MTGSIFNYNQETDNKYVSKLETVIFVFCK